LSVTSRFGVAGLILLAVAFRQLRTLTRRELEQGLALALFNTGGILFQMDGLAYTSASTSAFLTQGYCIFIPVWVAVVDRRWPSWKLVVSILLVLAGVGMLADIHPHDLRLGRGELETLVASLFFTGQLLLLENPRYAVNRPLGFTVVMMLGTALLSLPLVGMTAPSAGAWRHAYAAPAACGLTAVIIGFSTLAAYTLMNFWQRYVSATEAGLIYCAEPVFASVLALFLPACFSAWAGIQYANERLTAHLLIGGALITAANVMLHWKEPEPEVKPAVPGNE
jgi:drug/metabolite transporter (DMT)-like permease